MERTRLSRRRGCRVGTALLLVWLVALGGCSQGRDEPGLFGRSEPRSAPPRVGPSGPDTVAADLPVVGEAVWTSGDGLSVQVRIAVHAIRRLPGATVLDWSITPLRGPGLGPGDAVPPGLELGLTGPGGTTSVFLVDAFPGRVYRPLLRSDPGTGPQCLCTPVGAVPPALRIGQTRLLQIAYPELPSHIVSIDVDIATVPMFWHVPVTAVGKVPQLTSRTDLAREADTAAFGASTPVFGYGDRRQQLLISVETVRASSTFTSVQWTIQSVSAGAGLDAASEPPLAGASPPGWQPANPVAASGPRVRPVGGRYQSALWMTAKPTGAAECLCSDLRRWATSLRAEAQQVTVVTNLPPLPIGTMLVDVAFPGLTTLRGFDVTPATDASTRSAGPVVAVVPTWTSQSDFPVPGWSTDRWPTPLPDPAQLSGYRATVDSVIE